MSWKMEAEAEMGGNTLRLKDKGGCSIMGARAGRKTTRSTSPSAGLRDDLDVEKHDLSTAVILILARSKCSQVLDKHIETKTTASTRL
jgi:hypothetical protein